ncbi:LPS export ABC transporter permease LptF [Gallaecimonas sp. GXIMD4217]|uniref:LPS export ABC transporter permease LptF n=1 Tax=Gallaecimonas sp. GXIMD4217 TaxID=3131927 RepID=UPI00311B3FB5
MKSTLAVAGVLMAIFMSREFVSVLSDAAEGDIPGTLVATVIGLHMPALLALILPLALFIGVLLAHGRMYAEHEMTVLHSCGVSEWYVARVTLVLGLVFALLGAGISLVAGPWALEKEYQLIEKAQASSGLATLQEGRFQRTANGKAVVFIEDISRDGGELDSVFVAQLSDGDGKSSVLMAAAGRVEDGQGDSQRLVLEEGNRYEGKAGQPQLQELAFSSYSLAIGEQEVQKRRRKLAALPLAELLQDDSPDARAEIQWRLALPLSIPLLILIAVPMAQVSPRQGKFAKLMPALGLYMGYFLLLLAGRRALEDGKLPMELGLWWIHASALVIGVALIIKGRSTGTRLMGWMRRRP